MKKEKQRVFILKNRSGFTFLELLTVIGIIAILTSMVVGYYADSRKKANDTLALNDAKNMITIASGIFSEEVDVDFTHDIGDGPQIGTSTFDAPTTNRKPVYNLSPGVEAVIAGQSSKSDIEVNTITLYTFHVAGTGIPGDPWFITAPTKVYMVQLDGFTGDIDTSFTKNQ